MNLMEGLLSEEIFKVGAYKPVNLWGDLRGGGLRCGIMAVKVLQARLRLEDVSKAREANNKYFHNEESLNPYLKHHKRGENPYRRG